MKTSNNSVLVSNLSASIDIGTLEDMFSMVGNVSAAHIQKDAKTGLSLGYAVVEMSTPEEARNCVLHFNGQKKEGQTLIVREEAAPRMNLGAPSAASRKPLYKKLMAAAAAGRKSNRISK